MNFSLNNVFHTFSEFSNHISFQFLKFLVHDHVKANHLAYIEPRWSGSRISAECQQNRLSLKDDTSGRFLLVTFIEEQKNERTLRKW